MDLHTFSIQCEVFLIRYISRENVYCSPLMLIDSDIRILNRHLISPKVLLQGLLRHQAIPHGDSTTLFLTMLEKKIQIKKSCS